MLDTIHRQREYRSRHQPRIMQSVENVEVPHHIVPNSLHQGYHSQMIR
ncbi:hypothetical protein M0802_011096 [Mischocyttarus mexicanus]|nr:hypothetical protein M0802_011096 [Mischocyttarus mexicanus]